MKNNPLLTGLLRRLAVELEAECMAAVEAGGDVLDVPIKWLDSHGFGYLDPHPQPLSEALRPRLVAEFDTDSLSEAAKIVRNALYIADEVQQLDGQAALEFVAGWIAGASLLAHGVGAGFYLSNLANFVPVHRELFNRGFEAGEADAIARRDQKRREVNHV